MNKTTETVTTVAVRIVTAGILMAAPARAAELFPFVPPWDDASPSATNLSAWLDKPAGREGFVTVKDGHLHAGEKRLRLFGVNMAFGGNFPTHDAAEKIAARMAKFGINCVRFHHMDSQNTPGGIFAKDGSTLDPERLDRLDYFVAQLKSQGIYTDLNLHVSRSYPDMPRGEKATNPNFDKGVDNFSAAQIALQKDFARDLLTHVNPYTKNAYTDEPAVALIEINNENALLNEWHNGGLDRASAPYRAELAQLWHAWLRERHGDETKLRTAWAAGAREAGPELLAAGGWFLDQHGGAKAELSLPSPEMQVTVRVPGREAWHVQLGKTGVEFEAGETYALTFRARADAPRSIAVNASQAHSPWKVFANKTFALTAEMQSYTFVFTGAEGDKNARIVFSNLGLRPGTFSFAEVRLRKAGIDGSLPPDGKAPAFTRDETAGRTEAAQRDWYRFLWSLEEKYWPGMYRFIREELKAKPLIVGTQLGWSPAPIQAAMDVIDSHAYWQHPHFPGRPWDMSNWTVKNVSMAGASDGGTIPGLALQRIAGKPYICTEYSHPAPNEFSSEGFPLICAYAALQDWDGVFAFAYSHRGDDWEKDYFSSFFDIDRHPTKMATLAASVALFLRGDVTPANMELTPQIPVETAMEHTRRNGPRGLHAGLFGVDRLAALVHRTGVSFGPERKPVAETIGAGAIASDTGELVWDTAGRVVTIDTARSKGVIGSTGGRTFALGDWKITAGPTSRNFATIQATVVEGSDFASAIRILITATGIAENTGMKWTSDLRDSVGKQWGRGPLLVEGITATIQMPAATKLRAWALDERGQRREEVPVKDGILKIGPEQRTLWYELAPE